MNEPKKDEQYSEAETEQRMKDALKRALNTPPKPHEAATPVKKRETKPRKID